MDYTALKTVWKDSLAVWDNLFKQLEQVPSKDRLHEGLELRSQLMSAKFALEAKIREVEAINSRCS
jgi:hypothetical protein